MVFRDLLVSSSDEDRNNNESKSGQDFQIPTLESYVTKQQY